MSGPQAARRKRGYRFLNLLEPGGEERTERMNSGVAVNSNHFIAAFDLSAIVNVASPRHEFAAIRRRISSLEGLNANDENRADIIARVRLLRGDDCGGKMSLNGKSFNFNSRKALKFWLLAALTLFIARRRSRQ
jgi:hypothetical protein